MSGNRIDGDSSFLDELFLEDLGDDELTEEELIAMVGQGGPSGFHDEPTPGYGGHFSSADGMTAQAAMPEVTDENWRIRGDKVLFDRSASDDKESTTMRLIRPEDVSGAKMRGEFVPISKRNLVAVASKDDGRPRMWIVAEKAEDMFGAAGMVFVRED